MEKKGKEEKSISLSLRFDLVGESPGEWQTEIVEVTGKWFKDVGRSSS